MDSGGICRRSRSEITTEGETVPCRSKRSRRQVSVSRSRGTARSGRQSWWSGKETSSHVRRWISSRVSPCRQARRRISPAAVFFCSASRRLIAASSGRLMVFFPTVVSSMPGARSGKPHVTPSVHTARTAPCSPRVCLSRRTACPPLPRGLHRFPALPGLRLPCPKSPDDQVSKHLSLCAVGIVAVLCRSQLQRHFPGWGNRDPSVFLLHINSSFPVTVGG